MEAKEKLQLEILTAMRNMVDETQLQILKSTLEGKMYNYSVREMNILVRQSRPSGVA